MGWTDWHRHALSGYTWMRTNRGPPKSWLHYLGKAEDTGCPCGHPSQEGDHIVFSCTKFYRQRKALLGPRKSWQELDEPNWRKDEGDDSHWDTVEATSISFTRNSHEDKQGGAILAMGGDLL